MSVIINTNYAATMAANNLAASNEALQRSLNRLSSGSKIVNPADDAGGLAVSMKLSAAAKRQSAALTNISNSMSLLQTQDGALKVVGKILERVGELKALASDVTKSATDISNYNAEFTALQAQIIAVGAEKFNGVTLFSSSTLGVGTNEDATQSVNVGGIDLLASGTGANLLTENFTGANGTLPAGFANGSTAGGTAAIQSNALSLTTVAGSDAAQVTTSASFTGPIEINFDLAVGANSVLSISNDGTYNSPTALWSIGSADTASHHIRITYDGAGNTTITSDGGNPSSRTVSAGAGPLTLTASNFSGGGSATLDNLTVDVWDPSAAGDVYAVAHATSLTALDAAKATGAVEEVATHRATNGAQQSRLGFAAELLTTNKANLEAANSRIVDVDVATESSQLARNNVLVQAGTSMLAQANQASQMALKLLS